MLSVLIQENKKKRKVPKKTLGSVGYIYYFDCGDAIMGIFFALVITYQIVYYIFAQFFV